MSKHNLKRQETFKLNSGTILSARYKNKCNVYIYPEMITLNSFRSVLVCVTQQKSCERLIKAGAALKSEDGTLYVIHVTKDNWNFTDDHKDGEAMEYLFNLAKSDGAELTILNSNKIPETIAQFAHHYDIELIIAGEGPKGAESSFLKRLSSLLQNTGTELRIIPGN